MATHEEFQELSKSHARHQFALSVLSVALLVAMGMMWLLVSEVREANEIHKDILVPAYQVDVAAKTPVKPESVARSPRKASAAARRAPSASGTRERSGPERTFVQSAGRTQVATAQTQNRYGRQ
jgi:hypothetical protein